MDISMVNIVLPFVSQLQGQIREKFHNHSQQNTNTVLSITSETILERQQPNEQQITDTLVVIIMYYSSSDLNVSLAMLQMRN